MGFQEPVDLTFHSQQLEGEIQELRDVRVPMGVLGRQTQTLL